jgi:hypothetical protein
MRPVQVELAFKFMCILFIDTNVNIYISRERHLHILG